MDDSEQEICHHCFKEPDEYAPLYNIYIEGFYDDYEVCENCMDDLLDLLWPTEFGYQIIVKHKEKDDFHTFENGKEIVKWFQEIPERELIWDVMLKEEGEDDFKPKIIKLESYKDLKSEINKLISSGSMDNFESNYVPTEKFLEFKKKSIEQHQEKEGRIDFVIEQYESCKSLLKKT